MKSENLIHIRIASDEARIGRKDILSTEVSLIKIAQRIKAYKELRLKELDLKIELDRKIREFKNAERVLKGLLPKLKIPKILESKEEKEIREVERKLEKVSELKHEKKEKPLKEKSEPKPKKEHVDALEMQLREIQERLSQLG